MFASNEEPARLAGKCDTHHSGLLSVHDTALVANFAVGLNQPAFPRDEVHSAVGIRAGSGRTIHEAYWLLMKAAFMQASSSGALNGLFILGALPSAGSETGRVP